MASTPAAANTDLKQRTATKKPTSSNPITDGPKLVAANASTQQTAFGTIINGISNGASNLANLLPTGTFLAFTAIAPIVTDRGACDERFEYYLTIAVVAFFGLFCVFSCFTDSFLASDGKVYYGLVTLKGLWTPQLPEALHPGDKDEFKLTVVDVIHAILSLAVFAACALSTSTVQECLYPKIDHEYVTIVPAVVGFVASSAFVTFPSKRHGVGFPLSPAKIQQSSGAIREVINLEQAVENEKKDS